VLTGLLFGLIAWVVMPAAAWANPQEFGTHWLTALVYCVITSALIALSLIDIDYRILPDAITWPGIYVGPIFAFLAPAGQHGRFAIRIWGTEGLQARGNAAVNGVVFAAVASGLLYGIGWLGSRCFKKPAMGLGDVKMIAAMGAFQGVWVLLSLMVASVVGAVVGILARTITKSRYIPFGPFLALGMLTVMLWGPEILRAYLDRFQQQ
jgi:leader peptidase (prepilin peptidase)/N-methyltransferase